MTSLTKTLLGTALLLAAASCGGTDGTKTGEECVKSDLIEQCPPGSDPRLDAEASSKCEGSADGSLITEELSVTGSCAGTGSCQVLCQFVVPCDCGVDRIDDTGVYCESCSEQAACGNDECEPTETATECPEDCGAQCEPAKERCNGNDRQVCDINSRWETLACPDGNQCSVDADHRDLTECVAL